MAEAARARDRDAVLFGIRHRTAREAVFASQRGRMLDAVTKAIAEKGHSAVTIGDVVGRASVSRRTFYEHFEDKDECFLAAFDAGVAFVRSRIEQEFASLEPGDWRGRVRLLLETYLGTLAAEPEFAKVSHIDILAAGERALERWSQVLHGFVALYRSLHELAREQDPAIPAVSDESLLVFVGGVPELVREYIRTGRTSRLPELAPAVTELAIGILSGVPRPGSRRMASTAGSRAGSSGRRPRLRRDG